MPVVIPDTWLAEAGVDEAEVRLEIACRLYDTRRISFSQAIRWAGVSRTEFEAAMIARNLSVYRPSLDDLQHDMETLASLKCGT